jgi:CheY-like chemotaxis protein
MRTPLHGIIGEADNLEWHLNQEYQSGKISSELLQAFLDSLSIIASSSRIQLQLVNNLLDFQKLASRKVQLDFTHFDPRDLVQTVIQNSRALIRLRGAKVNVDFDDSMPEIVFSDAFKVTQIITNFFDNAIKYGGTKPSIMVRCHLEDDKLKMHVKDNGQGVPSAQQSLLFQRFSRLTQDSAHSGTGLGLCISRQLADMIGGHVWYEDNPEDGSIFSLALPIDLTNIPCKRKATDDGATEENIRDKNHVRQPSLTSELKIMDIQSNTVEMRVEPVEVRRPPTPPISPPMTRTPISSSMDTESAANQSKCLPILIVEDNLINQKVLVRMLLKFGFDQKKGDIHLANDGVEALERFSERSYPLIFMDMSMPRMDGVEATRKLRELGCQAYIVGVSANAMDEHKKSCLDAGMNEFLVKPVQLKQLEAAIQHLLNTI